MGTKKVVFLMKVWGYQEKPCITSFVGCPYFISMIVQGISRDLGNTTCNTWRLNRDIGGDSWQLVKWLMTDETSVIIKDLTHGRVTLGFDGYMWYSHKPTVISWGYDMDK